MRLFFICAAIALFFGCKKAEVTIFSEINNNALVSSLDLEVHNAILKHQKTLNTVGVSIGIFRNDSTFFYGYGETKKGNSIVPQATTFYEIGSITKTLTTLAILNMLKENNETIDQPIRKYLPADLPTLQRNGKEVTFKHILTHTSGLPYFPENFGFGLYTSKTDESFAKYDRNKLFSCLKNVRLNFDPGSDFEYSNTGMGLLGTILELNYNQTYDAVLKTKIFEPLDLIYAATRKADTDQNNWATGYAASGKTSNYWESLGALNGAGVVKMNMIDLLKYGEANINTSANALENIILQSHTISYLPFEETSLGQINGRLGWFQVLLTDVPDASFIWHNGGTGGFNSELFISKEKKTVLALFFNKTGDTLDGRDKLITELLQIVNQ